MLYVFYGWILDPLISEKDTPYWGSKVLSDADEAFQIEPGTFGPTESMWLIP